MKRPVLSFLAIITCLCSGILLACQAPVFRYALERWRAGTWKIVVLSAGPLSPEQTQSLRPLLQSPASDSHSIETQHIDIAAAAPSDRRRWEPLWQAADNDAGPVVVALYPQPSNVDQAVAHVKKLSVNTAERILYSPIRRELAARLSAGHSVVWLFLESGNMQSDRDTFERLKNQLESDERRIKLPTATDLQVTPEQLSSLRIPLKLQFSILRLSRDDPDEKFLVDSLLSSEADLRDLKDPIAFPVFGRGRVLYALVGKGIDQKTISDASDFLSGPCSCQVKEQNPGFDLLLLHDWPAAIGNQLVSSPIPQVQQKAGLLKIPPGRETSIRREKPSANSDNSPK
ncbi:MAG: hypothetical protein ACKOEO_26050 [Planctomycetaceae bacterium]